MNQPIDAATLAAIARENGDDSLAEWLDQHVTRPRDLPEWIQREAEQVRRERRWRALRPWISIAVLAVAVVALVVWAIAGAADHFLAAAAHPQLGWHADADQAIAP